MRLKAATFFGTEAPQYRWALSDSHIVAVEPDSVAVAYAGVVGDAGQTATLTVFGKADSAVVSVTAVGDPGQTATLTVFDEANGFDKQVAVEIVLGTEGQMFPLSGGTEMAFVWIEPGVFQRVKRSFSYLDVYEVEISKGFYLGKYEITQGQWEAVMGTTPWSGQDYVQEHSSHPAVYISWNDVQEFVGRLNAAGTSLYRLPTEAEWEYACRAGTQTLWSFGDDESLLADYAWYRDNAWAVGEQYAHAVGKKLPNPWGLYDMHGNVAEWVQDRYGSTYYTYSPRVDPPGPSSGGNRVWRGGSFDDVARDLWSENRDRYTPDSFTVGIGARLVRVR